MLLYIESLILSSTAFTIFVHCIFFDYSIVVGAIQLLECWFAKSNRPESHVICS